MLRTFCWTLLGSVLLAAGCSSEIPTTLKVGAPEFESGTTKIEPPYDVGLKAIAFSPLECPTEPGASAVALANLDADPALDVVIGHSTTSTLTVGLNPGRGCPREASYATGRTVSALTLADAQSN